MADPREVAEPTAEQLALVFPTVRGDLSYQDLRDLLNNAVTEKFGSKKDYIYVEDFGEDWVVYSSDKDGEQMCAYSLTDSTVDLEDPESVSSKTSWVPMETKSAIKVPAVPKRFWASREIEPPLFGNLKVQVRSDDPSAVGIVGWPSTTGDAYDVTDWLGEYKETIRAGAFAKTLKESDYVPMLYDHKGDVLAAFHQGENRTMNLSEDAIGLRSDAIFDIEGNAASRYVVSAIGRGDLSKMSFAFRATKENWNEDYSDRGVNELQLFDTSVVKSPANKMTTVMLRTAIGEMLGREGIALMLETRSAYDQITSTRAIEQIEADNFEATIRAIRSIDERMTEDPAYRYCSRARTFIVLDLLESVRAGKTISSTNESLLKSALESLAQADSANIKVGAAIAESRTAISTTLGDTDPNTGEGKVSNQGGLDTGALNDGHPVLPSDGAGPRSAAPSILKAQRELELLKLRSRKN